MQLMLKDDDCDMDVADNLESRRKAYQLVYSLYLQNGYAKPNSSEIWLSLIDALPETTTFLVERAGQLIGVAAARCPMSAEELVFFLVDKTNILSQATADQKEYLILCYLDGLVQKRGTLRWGKRKWWAGLSGHPSPLPRSYTLKRLEELEKRWRARRVSGADRHPER